MKWLDNLASIKQLHKAGKCPYCGQENTDYRLLEISSGKGYGDVWCNDCKKAFHISRIEVSETDIREKQLRRGGIFIPKYYTFFMCFPSNPPIHTPKFVQTNYL